MENVDASLSDNISMEISIGNWTDLQMQPISTKKHWFSIPGFRAKYRLRETGLKKD